MVITVSGPHGAGKSTYAKAIANNLSLRYVSSGELFRKLAEKYHSNLEELSRRCEQDRTIDEHIDELTVEEAMKGDVVLEGQLVAWMARGYSDFNIYVTATFETRIKRIAERDGVDYNKARKETIARDESEARRYKEEYDIDISNKDIYDLILSTERLSKEKCIDILIAVCRQLFEK